MSVKQKEAFHGTIRASSTACVLLTHLKAMPTRERMTVMKTLAAQLQLICRRPHLTSLSQASTTRLPRARSQPPRQADVPMVRAMPIMIRTIAVMQAAAFTQAVMRRIHGSSTSIIFQL
jgi:hypothetical protein